jgi:hypothetical protein
MDLGEQMNCMTRIVLLIFIILLFTNIAYDVLFLAVSLLLIICIYYICRSVQEKKSENFIEHYGKVETVLEPAPMIPQNSYTNDFLFYPQTSDPRQPCRTRIPSQFPPLGINIANNNNQIINNNESLAWKSLDLPFEDTISLNQSRVGPPNPRTLVQPVIPKRLYDSSINDFVTFPEINDQKRQEFFQNGYVIQDYKKINNSYTQSIQENYTNSNYDYTQPRSNHQQNQEPIIRENYPNDDTYNNYSINQDYYNQDNYNNKKVSAINDVCGYNNDNLKYNLPVNYYSNRCQRQDDMKEYNKNLFSIPIQPGIYTDSQVNQNDASMYNLGISFTQPFLPTTAEYKNNILQYTENDPQTVKQIKNPPFSSENFNQPLRNEIYDPRLTGYGTSYRSYIEPVTGQPRFYYDDIDQYTQNNYISRNNLDIYGFAPSVGVVDQKVLQGDELRYQANQNYLDSQLQLRTELQQRLLHKNNNREWQQRIAPIYTQNGRSASGGATMSGFYK